MKGIALIRTFFSRNKAAAVLISILIFVSVFVLCWMQGLYDYHMRYINTLEKYAGGADLYMQWEPKEAQERIRSIISEVKKQPGVEMVLYKIATLWYDENDNFYNVYYYPSEMASRVDLGTDIQPYTSGNSIECVACHGLAKKGDTLTLHFGENPVLDFQVKGNTEESFLYPYFDTSGDMLTASDLLEEANALFVTGEKFLEFFEEYEKSYGLNCYVFYKENAGSEEIESARSVIQRQGGYLEISDVLKASEEFELAEVKHILLLPYTILIVITFACCAIILLIMQEKMEEYSIYFLCGCSKRRIAAICFGSLSTMIVFPCLLNFLILLFHEKISDIFGFSFGTVIYSGKQMLFTAFYLFAVLLITGIMEFIMIAGMSPVEMYRRMTR